MRQVPNWNQYFMMIANAVAKRSKDPSTQVGAVIVNKNNHIIGTGYNGMPPGYPEEEGTWKKPAKYKNVIHAEANAILHSIDSILGCNLYTTLFPCGECAKLVVASGVKCVYYQEYRGDFSHSCDFFDKCGIPYHQIKLELDS